MLKIVFELTFKYATTFENNFSFPLLFAFDPLPLIGCIVDAVDAESVSQAILNFPFVSAAIGPSIDTFAGDAVISEFPLINDSIGPCKLAVPI